MDQSANTAGATIDAPEASQLETLDITSPDARVHAFERYAELRQQCPVMHMNVVGVDDGNDPEGLLQRPTWLFTTYEAVSYTHLTLPTNREV